MGLGKKIGFGVGSTPDKNGGGGNLTAAEQAWVTKWQNRIDAASVANRGFGLHIQTEDKTLASYGQGMYDADGRMFTSDTLIDVRSVSKAVTGVMAVKHAETYGTGSTTLEKINQYMGRTLSSWTILNDNVTGTSKTDPNGWLTRDGTTLAVDPTIITMRQQLSHTNDVGQTDFSGSAASKYDHDNIRNATEEILTPATTSAQIAKNYDRRSKRYGNKTDTDPAVAGYDDKNGMPVVCAMQEDSGIEYHTELQTMFATMGVNAYPGVAAIGGSSYGYMTFFGTYGGVITARNAPNFCRPTVIDDSGKIAEEISSAENHHTGIAGHAFSARSLADFWDKVHTAGFYLTADGMNELFSAQTGAADGVGTYTWHGINWGYGPQKQTAVNGYEIWGSIGAGGFAANSSAYVHSHDLDHLTVAIVGQQDAFDSSTITGVSSASNGAGIVWDIAKDYADEFG